MTTACPWHVLLGDDPDLMSDTLDVYNTLVSEMGQVGLGTWLTLEHPYLDGDHVTPLRRWWVLQNKADELLALHTPAAWVVSSYPNSDAPYAEIANGLRAQGETGGAG